MGDHIAAVNLRHLTALCQIAGRETQKTPNVIKKSPSEESQRGHICGQSGHTAPAPSRNVVVTCSSPEDSNPLSLSKSHPSGFGLPSLAHHDHVQPLGRCRAATTARRCVRVCSCLRAAVSHILAYMVSPQARKAATDTRDLWGPRVKSLFF